MRRLERAEIDKALSQLNLMYIAEEAFAAQARGDAVTPLAEPLDFAAQGQVRIGYGYLRHDRYYALRVESRFAANRKLGLPEGNALSLLFSQQTGELLALLEDGGSLRTTRAAVTGAVAAKYLGPRRVNRVGLLGAGEQARAQLLYLQNVTDCRDVLVWDRSDDAADAFKLELSFEGFVVKKAISPTEVAKTCNLIVTATASPEPLLFAADVRPGTHITAVGADDCFRQELEPRILRRAQRLATESLEENMSRGEIHHALEAGCIGRGSVLELGLIINGERRGRSSEEEITVFDLSGSTVQDVQLASAVYEHLVGL